MPAAFVWIAGEMRTNASIVTVDYDATSTSTSPA